MNGVLVIDKPPGPTSHDVVATVRRAIGVTRVGHTGTLDPLATGVLPLVVGRATRLAQFLSAADKEYVADIRIGVVSETYDAEGPLTPFDAAEGGPFDMARGRPLDFSQGWGVEFDRVSQGPLEAVLAEFRGTHWQVPPPYSAKKIGGTPAYKLARRNKPTALEPVRVTVHDLEVLALERDLLRLRVVCSSGFYVRTLAHDLGRRLGCGAYLAALRRTRAGSFTLADAVPLDHAGPVGQDLVSRLIPLGRLLPEIPAVVLTEQGVRRVIHGNAVGPGHVQKGATPISENEGVLLSGGAPGGAPVRLLDDSGGLLAIADWRPGGLLHPTIVLV